MKTLMFVLIVGWSWTYASQEAMAQGNQDSDTARAATRFQQAVELYREGNFEGALAEFHRAYQLSPSYRVLYNISQTQYALHDFVGAYKSLTQYVNEGRGELPADRRVQVDEMSAKLSERIAQLHITTNVEGAEIRVDDVVVGTSPLSDLVPVNVGVRKVSVHVNGAAVAIRVVTVAGKEKVKVELPVVEAHATSTSARASEPRYIPSVTTDFSIATKPQPKVSRSRWVLMVSVSATAALLVSTGIAGYMAMAAQSDFKDQINSFPNTSAQIEKARSKSKRYALLADGLGAATLLSGGVALYFLFFDHAEKTKPITLSPTLGGLTLHGRF